MMTGRVPGSIAIAAAMATALACGGRDQVGRNGPPVTLTGCLQPGDTPNTFRLSAVESPNGPVGTSGDHRTSQQDNPTGTPSHSQSADRGAATTRVFTLVPSSTVDLGIHSGTMVQITGQLEGVQGASGTTDSAGTGRNAEGNVGPRTDNGGRPLNREPSNPGGNATTGVGPQSSAQGGTADRGLATVHVEKVKRVSGSCGDTR